MTEIIGFPKEWERKHLESLKNSKGEFTDSIYECAAQLEKEGWTIDLHCDLVPEWFTYCDPKEKKIWHNNPKANRTSNILWNILQFSNTTMGIKVVFSCLPREDVIKNEDDPTVDFEKIIRNCIQDREREIAFTQNNVVQISRKVLPIEETWGILVDDFMFMRLGDMPKYELSNLSNPE